MLSPAPSSAAPAPDGTEHLIGEVMAAAAIALLRALYEWETGRLTPAAKAAGGNLVAQLYELRAATMGEFDFEQVVRIHGLQALRARCVGEWNPVAGRILIDNVLDILRQVAKARSN